jgi:hypothetical protein
METFGFDKVVCGLKKGKTFSREIWEGGNICMVKPEQIHNADFNLPYIVYTGKYGLIMIGWVPSQADMFAEDWIEIEANTYIPEIRNDET